MTNHTQQYDRIQAHLDSQTADTQANIGVSELQETPAPQGNARPLRTRRRELYDDDLRCRPLGDVEPLQLDVGYLLATYERDLETGGDPQEAAARLGSSLAELARSIVP